MGNPPSHPKHEICRLRHFSVLVNFTLGLAILALSFGSLFFPSVHAEVPPCRSLIIDPLDGLFHPVRKDFVINVISPLISFCFSETVD